MSNKHVDEVLRSFTASTRRREQEIAEIRDRLQHQQYDAELLQRMRRLCGLAPDPQLKESKTDEQYQQHKTAA